MMLIYIQKMTPRVAYTFKHVLGRMLGLSIEFTTSKEDFIAHSGMKMSYAKLPLGDEFFVRSHDLLFEQGINDVEISLQTWEEGLPCFFSTGSRSSVPFDIFAASFYLLSRYEECLPHVRDANNCFPAEESLAFQNGFLEKPLVDLWACKLKGLLQLHFPKQGFKTRSYHYQSVFSICEAYAYKSKGVLRTFGGFLGDVLNFRLQNLWDRSLVLTGFKKDPYDTFDRLLQLKKKHQIDAYLFFLLADFTSQDPNTSFNNNRFRLLIKSMSDYLKVGLNASFYTMKNELLLKKELRRMESILNTPVVRTRQHRLRLHLPESYQHLIDLEVGEDHSMGYAEVVGFRASTCTPFYFYDLNFEIQTPLKVVPFAVSDTAFSAQAYDSPKRALSKVVELSDLVRSVQGTFVTCFHNDLLSGYGKWKGWKGFYASVVKAVV